MKKIVFFVFFLLILFLITCFFVFQKKDKEQVFSEDNFCKEITKEEVSKITGKEIKKENAFLSSSARGCKYYYDKDSFITIILMDLSFKNQKEGQKTLGRTVKESPEIKTENFMTLQETGNIHAIYLKVDQKKLIRIDRTPISSLDNEKLIELAIKISEKLN